MHSTFRWQVEENRSHVRRMAAGVKMQGEEEEKSTNEKKAHKEVPLQQKLCFGEREKTCYGLRVSELLIHQT